jgi:hypothetical protein
MWTGGGSGAARGSDDHNQDRNAFSVDDRDESDLDGAAGVALVSRRTRRSRRRPGRFAVTTTCANWSHVTESGRYPDQAIPSGPTRIARSASCSPS